jgi:hypothetical protein
MHQDSLPCLLSARPVPLGHTVPPALHRHAYPVRLENTTWEVGASDASDWCFWLTLDVPGPATSDCAGRCPGGSAPLQNYSSASVDVACGACPVGTYNNASSATLFLPLLSPYCTLCGAGRYASGR